MLARTFAAFAAILISTGQSYAQERQWSLNASEKEAFLVFGVPDTDDVGLSFWCEIGSKNISLFVPGVPAGLNPGQSTAVDLKLDGKTFSLNGKISKEKNSRLPSVESSVPTDDKLFSAVEDAQVIAITVGGHTNSYPVTDADIAGLLQTCSGESDN